LDLTRHAAFQVFEVEEGHYWLPVAVRDLVSGERVTLESCAAVRVEQIAGHFAGLSDGTRVTLGGIVRRGPAVWPTAAKQFEGGRGGAFRKPERAAEAIDGSSTLRVDSGWRVTRAARQVGPRFERVEPRLAGAAPP
jgi:hypothetical protein